MSDIAEDPMSVEKAKVVVETGKIVFDIVTSLIDRGDKAKEQAKRIADLEAEVERLKAQRP